MGRETRSVPPFTLDAARQTVDAIAADWNTRDPEVVALAYTADSAWRDRDELLSGRDAIRAFLYRKWRQELHHRLIAELWSHTEHRMAVRVEAEWQHARTGQWYRTRINEQWEFAADGLICRRDASANDVQIAAGERRIGF